MPSFLDPSTLHFPSYEEADEYGIIALGGDLSAKRLLRAYERGIFPWPHEGFPLLWFFPDPRYVLRPEQLVIAQSLKKSLKNTGLVITADQNFVGVMKACQKMARHDQDTTWITDDMIVAYEELHRLGFAHSIEAYRGENLVGGLYGVSLGSIFYGESMFYKESNASKICFVTMVAHLILWQFTLIDCQMPTTNLEKFGAKAVSQGDFLAFLAESRKRPTKMGPWHFHLSPQEALRIFSHY